MAKSSTRRVNIYINGKEIEASIKQVRAEMNRLINEQAKMIIGSDEYVAHAKKIRELRGVIQEHQDAVGSAASAWEKTYDKMMKFGAGIGGFTQLFSAFDGVVGKFKELATELATMDDIYSDVIKTTGLTREEVLDLNEQFAQMDTRTSREQLNNLAYTAGKLGISSKEAVLQFVEAADIINVAMGDVLGEDATMAVGKMVDVYKKSSDILAGKNLKEQILSLGSAINELGKVSTANEAYMVNFAGRLGGIAVQAGLSADQILGFASALDQDMQKVEMSATAFQKLVQKVISAPDQFAEVAGMKVKDFQKLISEDMNEALKKTLKGFSGAGGFDKLLPIFQDLGLDSARAASAIASMANSLDKVEAAQNTSKEAMIEATSATDEFKVKNNNMQAGLEKAQKRFKDMRIELGGKLYPALMKLTKTSTGFLKIASKLITWASENKLAVIALIAPYTLYLGKLLKIQVAELGRNGLKKIGNALDNASAAITYRLAAAKATLAGNTTRAAAAMRAYSAASKQVPWTAIVTAIAAIIVGITQWIKKTKELSKTEKFMQGYNEALEESNSEYKKQASLINDLVKIVNNENLSNEDRWKAINKLKEIMPEYNAQLSQEGQLIDDNTSAVQNYLAVLDLQMKAMVMKSKLLEAQNELDRWYAENGTEWNEEQEESRQRIIRSQHAYWEQADGVWDYITANISKTIEYFKIRNEGTNYNNLKDEKEGYEHNVKVIEKDYNKTLEQIAAKNGSTTEAVTGEDNMNACTGDYTTCTCPNCTEKRNQANATNAVNNDLKNEWESFLSEIAKLKNEQTINSLGELDKEKTQIEQQYASLLEKAKKFYKTKEQLAIDAENEIITLRDNAIENADKNYREKKLQDITTLYNKIAEEYQELKDKLGTKYEDKISLQLIATAKRWKTTFAELDNSIATLEAKEGEVYDAKKGTGLSPEEKATLERLRNQKRDGIEFETQEELDIIKSAQEEITEFLLDEKGKRIKAVEKEYQEKISIAETSIDKLSKIDANGNSKQIELLKQQISELKLKLGEEIGAIEDEFNSKLRVDGDGWLAELLNIDWKNFTKDWETNLQKIANIVADFANDVGRIFDNISQLQTYNEEKELSQYTKNYDARKEKLDWQLEQGIISQELYDKNVAELDKKMEQKNKEIELERFRREKKAALGAAIIQGIKAAIQSFASGGGYPFGLVTMALSIAETGTQIAAIEAQPEPFAKGGFIKNKKIILAGEQGQEWIASNSLVGNKEIAPYIHALEDYQQGNKRKWENLTMPQPDITSVSQAAQTISSRFVPSTKNDYYKNENENLSKMLKEISALREYMSDPTNRQAYISYKIQTEATKNIEFIKQRSKL